jgi:hypothetical protein
MNATNSLPIRRIGISPFWQIGQKSGPSSSHLISSQPATTRQDSGLKIAGALLPALAVANRRAG